jgi:outer membrane immunogenic protein
MSIRWKSLAVALLAVVSTSAFAQDAYMADPYAAGAPFEGVYAGAYTGAKFNPGTAVTLGVIAGANFSVTDNVLVGVEAQGGAAFSNPTKFDALMVGHVGYEFDDMAVLYGAAGGGLVNGTGSYVLGVGGEVMLVQDISLRGEILGTGPWGGGLNGAKANAGVLWHLR